MLSRAVANRKKDQLVTTEISTPAPPDLDTRGMDLDALLALAHEKGYSMDELVRRSKVGRQPLGLVIGDAP